MNEPPPKSARTLAGPTGGKDELEQHTPLLIDATTAASILALGKRTLWTLTQCNAVPFRRIGRSVRYSRAELEAWVSVGCPTTPGSGDRVRDSMREGGR